MTEHKDGYTDTLLRYQPYMQKFADSLDQSGFDKKFCGRYETFSHILKDFANRPQDQNIIIVELGTSRSFVDGAYPGCNSDDTQYWNEHDFSKWDYGAGAFTYLVAEFMTQNHPKFELYTVDLCAAHINRCKHMTRKFAKNITYIVGDSVGFLKKFRTKCDLIYLDTGDMTPIEPTAQLQLSECRTLVTESLVNKNGYVLIDDVRNPSALEQDPQKKNILGKAKYSIPYLKKEGFCVVMDEYQVVLQK